MLVLSQNKSLSKAVLESSLNPEAVKARLHTATSHFKQVNSLNSQPQDTRQIKNLATTAVYDPSTTLSKLQNCQWVKKNYKPRGTSSDIRQHMERKTRFTKKLRMHNFDSF